MQLQQKREIIIQDETISDVWVNNSSFWKYVKK